MNITGKCTIYAKEYNGKVLYSTKINKKDENNNWESMYISVQLPRETKLENKTKIEITKGFISFYKNHNGLALIKFIIQEFNVEEKQEENNYDTFESGLPF